MNQPEFAQLHKRFAASLHRYMKEASKLCELFGKCVEGPLCLELRSEIAVQRSAENEARAEYTEDRLRLIKAAQLGYRDLDK